MSRPRIRRSAVKVPVDHLAMDGELDLPAEFRGVVVVAHAERRSPSQRTAWQKLEAQLHSAELGTLSIPLVRADERQGLSGPLDLTLLAARLRAATQWIRRHFAGPHLPIGCCGSGETAAATLIAAAEQPDDIVAVVTHSGRPDLAGIALRYVAAATLLIVGNRDERSLAGNQLAFEELPATKSLEIVLGGGTELLEPVNLNLVASSTAGWLAEHLCAAEVR